tara:strand:+ start:37 stop:1677 length:1641 start_codon:yes stop_codon:yes gene_type:complete
MPATQSLTLKQGDSLKNLGSEAIWPNDIPKNTREAYKLRRLKIVEIENKLKDLFIAETITTPNRKKIRDLTRELKTVVQTDPTEAFKFDGKKWKYVIKDFYNAKDPLQAHHIKGLDKYYQPIKQLDDIDLFDFHNESAKKGHYFGNHPKNRVNINKSIHVGRERQAVPSFESIHGRIDFQDLTPEEFDEYFDRIISKSPTDDIGKYGGPKGIDRPRFEVPDDSFWEYGLTSDAKDKLFEMADADQNLANEFIDKQVNPVYFEGKAKTKITREFINNNPFPEEWPEGVEEALRNQDADALTNFQKQIDADKVYSFDAKLDKLKRGALKGGLLSSTVASTLKGLPGQAANIAKGILGPEDLLGEEVLGNVGDAERRIREGESVSTVLKEEAIDTAVELKDQAIIGTGIAVGAKLTGTGGALATVFNPVTVTPLLAWAAYRGIDEGLERSGRRGLTRRYANFLNMYETKDPETGLGTGEYEKTEKAQQSKAKVFNALKDRSKNKFSDQAHSPGDWYFNDGKYYIYQNYGGFSRSKSKGSGSEISASSYL